MDRVSNLFVIAIIAISVAATMLTAFSWFGPGLDNLSWSGSSTTLFDEDLVIDIYRRVSPAVVEISADRRDGNDFVEVASGTGFIVDQEGHIATNHHVISRAERVRVSLKSGENVPATILGRNPANDLALLKVDPEMVKNIAPAELGNSSRVVPGQLAIVIGSPFALRGSVTVGVSSGVNRELRSDLNRRIPGMLQTDALVSPGNSGSPLLDSSGRVVGITTALEIVPLEANSRSIGFAVPVNTLKELLPRLKLPGIVHPPWLGTGSQDVEPLLAERLKLPVERGSYVIRVTPGSPAALAGLIPSGSDLRGLPQAGGDIIVAVNGSPVDSGAALTSWINRHAVGQRIILTVVRQGSKVDIPVTLGDWPAGSS